MANQVLKGALKVVYNDELYEVHPTTEVSQVEGLNSLSAASIQGALTNATISGNNVSGGTIKAAVSAESIQGALTNATIAGSNISGNIPASQISGSLSNASIQAENVVGLSNVSTGSAIQIADVTNVVVSGGVGVVSLNWTDPNDLVLDSVTLAGWAGTKVVRKAGSAPTSVSDGTVVVDSITRNAYQNTAFVDNTVVNGTTYYYKFFPYTTGGVYTSGASREATPNLLTPTITLSEDNITVHTGTTVETKTVTVTSNSAGTITAVSNDNSIATVTGVSNGVISIQYVADGTTTVTVTQGSYGDYSSTTAIIAVKCQTGFRYGYKISKTESDPTARVTYIYDAEGFTPAAMNFTTNEFSYGSWADVWFVKNNKPLMLKSDGTVDYYLYQNDYTKKAGGTGNTDVTINSGTASDVSNTSYNGNAMAQIPLCYVYRYEDSDYIYEIVSDIQYDSNYKAYAHTNTNGEIKDYFYFSMFDGSGGESKIRSIKGQTCAQSLTAQKEINGCTANGTGWYTHTWSQRELIRTLAVLLGKSTDTQAVYGKGNANSATSASALKTTGTLHDKGQFYGTTATTDAVKIFHIENFWGNQWDRTAGLINNSGTIYVKMTPEGDGYRITDVTGMTNTSLTPPSNGYIKSMSASEYGLIPSATGGSETTYFADYHWTNNSQLDYLIAGGSADHTSARAGAFAFDVNNAPSPAAWNFGCGLSYIAS